MVKALLSIVVGTLATLVFTFLIIFSFEKLFTTDRSNAPADCRPHHVGQVATVLLIDGEARCMLGDIDIPKAVWKDYLHGKVVPK